MTQTDRITLAHRYGSLTVLGEKTEKGIRHARVKCNCGITKWVQASDLYRNRTKSCGHGACKAYHRVEYDPTYWPQMPKACTLEQLQAWWKVYNAGSAKKRQSVPQIAAANGINVDTLTYLFRAIRRAGGIQRYTKRVKLSEERRNG